MDGLDSHLREIKMKGSENSLFLYLYIWFTK